MKKIFSIILGIFIIISANVLPVQAKDISNTFELVARINQKVTTEQEPNVGNVHNNSEYIIDFTKEKLEKRIQQIKKKYRIEVAVLILNSDVTWTESELNQYYIQNDFGVGPDRSGGLIYINSKTDEVIIYRSGKLKEMIDESTISQLADKMKKEYLAGRYMGILDILEESIKGDTIHLPTIHVPTVLSSGIKLSVFVGLAVFFITTLTIKRRYSTHRGDKKYKMKLKGTLFLTEQNDWLADMSRSQRLNKRK